MTIEWIAHSCFKIRLESGREIVFDPFEDSIGYTRVDTTADIVLVSHDHYDHNCLDQIKGEYTLVNTPENRDLEGVVVEGFKTFHDKTHGIDRGENICFRVQAEGLTLLHMGDIGEVPSEEFFAEIGNIDILMIPVGGVYTIDANEAVEICKRIDPNIIIPMHYKTQRLRLDVDTVFRFTEAAGRYFDRSRLGGSSFRLTADDKKKRTRIMIMESSLEA